MINDSQIDTSAINAGAHNVNGLYYDYYYPYEYAQSSFINILFDFIVLICIFGILGNGMVICLLGCCIKRSPFTIFILNLAVADSGVLISTIMFGIDYFSEYLYILQVFSIYIFFCMFSTSQMFLTVISVDKCISVFFPLWHRCHRPKWLSTLVCNLTWLLSSLTVATDLISDRSQTYFISKVIIYLFIANCFLCIRLMTISSLMLFLQVFCKARQKRRQKLLTTILVTVAFFLLCCIPFNIFMFTYYLNAGGHHFFSGAMFLACLKSSINPLIYYFIGRQMEGCSKKSMKGILKNLFKEEKI